MKSIHGTPPLYSHDVYVAHRRYSPPSRRDFRRVTKNDSFWAGVLWRAGVRTAMSCANKHPDNRHAHQQSALADLSIALWLAGYQRGGAA